MGVNLFLSFFLLLGGSFTASSEELKNSLIGEYIYVVSIVNQNDVVSKKSLRRLKHLTGYAIYELPIKNRGDRTLLRVGFFATEASANIIIDKIYRKLDAKTEIKVLSIPENEKNHLNFWLKNYVRSGLNNRKLYDRKKLELLMEQARLAMVQNDYRRAIANYTKVIGYEVGNFSQSALEYLGLARERNQQFAHAKAEYQRYLKLYPNTEGAERVRQRLVGIMSAAMAPKARLRKAKRRKRKTGWLGYGSVAQYYRRDAYLDDQKGENLLSSNAYSSFYYTARLKNQRYEMQNRISVSHNMDFKDVEDNKSIRVSTLYTDIHQKKNRISGRFGRQIQSSSGAYGRFDGAAISYRYNPTVVAQVSTGFPVSFDSFNEIRTNKRFYSVNVGVDSLLNSIDLNSYFISQYEKEILDRRAIGLELNHFDAKQSFYSTFEYDISYQVVNNLMANIMYQLLPKTTIGGNINYRRSPLLSTTNALQGQGVDNLKDLKRLRTEAEIRQLARDRTAQYASATASVTYRLTKKIQFSNDYTVSRLSGTVSSDGVTGIQATGYEHYLSTQFIASDWYRKNDVTIASLQYAVMSGGRRYTLNLLRQDRLRRKLIISSRLRTDYQLRNGGNSIFSISPTFKVNYRYSKSLKVDFEAGLVNRLNQGSFDAGRNTTGFFAVGYFFQF